MIFNVVDVEATCWEPRRPDLRNEIIEVGITMVSTDTGFIDIPVSILVHPETTKISPFCTELTTITQEMIDRDGISFDDMLDKLYYDHDADMLPWASYGEYDKNIFMENCRFQNQTYPFSDVHVNVKKLVEKETGRRMGMAAACKHFGIKLTGTHHRGGDDSYNIAKILLKVYRG